MEMRVTAENIKCAGCVAAITEALGKLPGISSVSVDIPTGNIDISGETIDETKIKTLLAETGYPARQ